MINPDTDVQFALDRLADVPFVERIDVCSGPTGDAGDEYPPDAYVKVRTATGEVRFCVEVKRTHVTHAIADRVVARARARNEPLLLVAAYVPAGIGERLAHADVNYVDEVGNYRLAVGHQYLAVKEGRKPARKPPGVQGTRLAGYKVMFTLLARPDYLALPVRELAAKAGVGKTAAADAVNRLIAQGLAGRGAHRQLLDPPELMDRWLAAYATYVRPRLFLGAYKTRYLEPPTLEAAIEHAAPRGRWALGGGAAADRMTHYYRGRTTVLHVEERPRRLLRDIGALAADDGPLIVLGIPGPVALEGSEPHIVHPLLVYTELYAENNERAREAARIVAERFLQGVG